MDYQYLRLPLPGQWPTVERQENLDAANPPNPDQNVVEDEEDKSHVIVIQL